MSDETILTNARLVLPDEVCAGHASCCAAIVIAEVQPGRVRCACPPSTWTATI